MRTMRRWGGCAIVVALAVGAGCALAQELLINPGFEREDRGRPGEAEGWTFQSFYGGSVDKIKLTEQAHGGVRAVRLEPKAGFAGLKSAPFRVEPGRRHLVSVWVRIEPPSGASPPHPERGRFDAFCGDLTFQTFSLRGASDVIGQRTATRLFLARGATGWRRYEQVFTAWPDSAAAVLYLRFAAHRDGFLVDDVSVTPAPDIPERVEFSRPEHFLTLRAAREDGYVEDVVVDEAGIALARTPNLTPNASFESDADNDGVPDGWAFSGSEKDRTCALDSTAERVLDGKRSVKLTGGAYGWCELISDPVTLEPNDEYVLSACYHFDGDGQPQMRLVGGDGQELHQRDLFRMVAPYPWLREEVRMRPGAWKGARAKTARVALRLYGRGSLWFDGVVLRKGLDRGVVAEKESSTRRGRLVSPIIEIGAAQAAKLSWEADGEGVEMFARVGPGDTWSPRAWTQWRGVTNGGDIFLPAQGIPLSMQWKADLRLDEKAGRGPLLRKVVVERAGMAPPQREWIEVCRMKQGFIDPRDLPAGWKKYLGWKKEHLEEQPDFIAFARDRAAGAPTEADRMAQVRGRMIQQLVLYNAYLGAGPGVRGMEMVSQGTGVGCGAVNAFYGEALKRLGMQVRQMGMGALDGSGHSVLDVWSNEYDKWVFSDCFYGSVFLSREGTPLAFEEVFDLWRQDRMEEVEYSTWGAPYTLMFRAESHYSHGSQAPGPMRKRADSLLGEFESYNLCGATVNEYGQAPSISCLRDGFPLVRIHPYGGVACQGMERECVDFKINQTEVFLTAMPGGKVKVRLAHNMPGFDRFEALTDERAGWKMTPAEFEWPLAQGTNSLQARCVNAMGATGPAAEVGLRYGPPFAEPAAPAAAAAADRWRFPHRWRVALDVSAGLYDRDGINAEARVDLDAWAGVKVDRRSLRLVAVKGADAVDAPFLLNDGVLILAVAGRTPLMATRRFYLYFDAAPTSAATPAIEFPRLDRPNWVPNGGFEASAPGPDGGVAEPDKLPFGTPPKGLSARIVEDVPDAKERAAAEGRRCVVLASQTGKEVSFLGPFFRIQPDTPVEVVFSARAPGKQGLARVYLAPCDEQKNALPWNSNKVTAQAKFENDRWTEGKAYGLTDSRAAWGRLRIDVNAPEVWLDDIIVRRRDTPEAAPATVVVGEPERRAE